MASLTVDVLVVGFGKAGKTIAMKRAAAGDRVALVERSPSMYGGTCINVACVPTKTLLVSAHRHFRDGTGNDDTAFGDARSHRNAFIAKLNAANKTMVDGSGAMVVDGTARFVSAHTVEVTGGDDVLQITGETVVINTGSVPIVPDIPGADGPRVHDSTAIQQLDPRPRRLAILGGGPIALEFATMFAQFGTEVTVIDRSTTFLPKFDRDIADAARTQLERLGVTIRSGSTATEFVDQPDSVRVRLDDGSTLEADHVLLATGRRPATDGLGLEGAGVALDDRGAVRVDAHLRTNVDRVYAVGDVNGGPQFTYVSYDDHRVVLSDRWDDGARTADGRVIPTTTFLEPPLSTVGLGEAQAREEVEGRGHTLDVKASDIADIAIMPRPKILGEPQGRAKFLVDREEDRIVGAALFCVDSQELINTVALAMANDVPATAVGSAIYTHPSSSEVFNALLES